MARTRSSTNALGRLLASSLLPIYVLDDQRRIVYCNPACAQWTGVPAEQLIDVRCDYHSSPQGPGAEAVAAGLCPPPEVFRGCPTTGTVACCNQTGQLVHRRAEFLPLKRAEPSDASVLVVLAADDLPPEDCSARSASFEPGPAELHQRLLEFHQRLQARYQLDQLVGDSPAMRRVRAQVGLALAEQTRVLIVGPPGSGREQVARTIHYGGGPAKFGQLVPLSCSLLDAELLQSTLVELFKQRQERELEWESELDAERQQSSALMLLDLDRLPADAQSELAGFLNLPGFELYTIATARKSLLELAQQGQFRHDLAHALSTLVIELPALAERSEDIPLLAQYFLEQCNAAGGRQLGGFTPEALDQLVAYSWPQNTDELAQWVREACRRAGGPLVGSEDLPQQSRWAADLAAHPRRAEETVVLDELLGEIEVELLRRALQQAKGNKAQAARLLGMTRARLHRRLAQWGL